MTHKIALTIAEAAEAIGIGRTKLYELINAGELKRIKLGSRALIRLSDLEAMLERHASEQA
jgi:excisionase family DNA binding protein